MYHPTCTCASWRKMVSPKPTGKLSIPYDCYTRIKKGVHIWLKKCMYVKLVSNVCMYYINQYLVRSCELAIFASQTMHEDIVLHYGV